MKQQIIKRKWSYISKQSGDLVSAVPDNSSEGTCRLREGKVARPRDSGGREYSGGSTGSTAVEGSTERTS